MHQSPLSGLRGAHVRLIGQYGVRFSLRTGGGLMTLLLILTVGLVVASIFIMPVEQLMKASPELGHSESEALVTVERLAESRPVVEGVEWVTGADKADAEYLLRGQPALLSAILLVLLMLFPYIACIAGFNQTSSDISARGLRYLLLRTERANIFFGRFLGAFVYTGISTAGLIIVVGLYVGLKFGIYGFGEISLWLTQGWIALLLIVLPYLALCAWISGVMDSAFGSLTICTMMVVFPVAFLSMADMALAGDQAWLQRLTPWGWKYELLSGDVGKRLLAYGAMLGFTALLLFIGSRAFAKRDL